jgi:hypothetical protein
MTIKRGPGRVPRPLPAARSAAARCCFPPTHVPVTALERGGLGSALRVRPTFVPSHLATVARAGRGACRGARVCREPARDARPGRRAHIARGGAVKPKPLVAGGRAVDRPRHARAESPARGTGRRRIWVIRLGLRLSWAPEVCGQAGPGGIKLPRSRGNFSTPPPGAPQSVGASRFGDATRRSVDASGRAARAAEGLAEQATW